MLAKDRKDDIKKQFAKSEKDSGSVEIQIALLTERIGQITEHLKSFPKDTHSRIGLIKLVGKKRTLCNYLQKNDKASYDKIMSQLKRK